MFEKENQTRSSNVARSLLLLFNFFIVFFFSCLSYFNLPFLFIISHFFYLPYISLFKNKRNQGWTNTEEQESLCSKKKTITDKVVNDKYHLSINNLFIARNNVEICQKIYLCFVCRIYIFRKCLLFSWAEENGEVLDNNFYRFISMSLLPMSELQLLLDSQIFMVLQRN